MLLIGGVRASLVACIRTCALQEHSQSDYLSFPTRYLEVVEILKTSLSVGTGQNGKRNWSCPLLKGWTILLGMQPIPAPQQRSLVERLTKMCGGGYSPEVRRKYFISGPQWAAA